MQRYKFHQNGPAAGYTEERRNGDWVLYSDALAAQAADKERIKKLEEALNTKMLGILQRLEDWGMREDKMFTETREKTLFKLISDAQTVLHEVKP